MDPETIFRRNAYRPNGRNEREQRHPLPPPTIPVQPPPPITTPPVEYDTTDPERAKFIKDHPSLALWGLLLTGVQKEHPAVEEALKPIDTAVTKTRDVVEGGVDVLSSLYSGLNVVWQYRYPIGGVLALLIVKNLLR